MQTEMTPEVQLSNVDVHDPGTNTVTAERRCERPTIELTGVKYWIR